MKNINIIYTALFCVCFLQSSWSTAQNIGINTTGAAPDSSAMLDIVSNDKGLLIPRMDSTTRKNILTPAQGLMVFDSTYNSFWYYNGTAWQAITKGLDQQDLNRSNDSLYLTNNTTGIDLSIFKQNLNFTNDTLRLTNSPNPIDLSSFNMENLGNHIATQNIQLNGHYINNDGDATEGIYIDTNGYVGLNTIFSPQAPLHIDLGPNSTLNTSLVNGGINGSAAGTVWQSFSSTYDTYLATFICYNSATTPPAQPTYNFNIYEGEGTVGTLLYSGTSVQIGNRRNDCIIPNIPILKDSTYSIEIIRDASNTETFAVNTTNQYTRGRLSTDPQHDLTFNLWTRDPKPGYQFTDTALIINGYRLTLNDGNANEVLMLDATGKANWANLASSGLTDNMGNHTASQNLQLNNNWLSHNGQNDAGLYVSPTGQVGFKTIPSASFHVPMGGGANPGFRVNDTGVTINEYSLPAEDGTSGQILVSDGAGTLNWTTPVAGANQQLSLSGDTLYLTDGGSPISLTPYLDADNLGNHTATTNIHLGSHWIQNNNAAAEGLQFNNVDALFVQSAVSQSAVFKNNDSGRGTFIEINNRRGTRALFGPEGIGYTGGDTTDVALAIWGVGGDLRFHTNTFERMRIDSVGKVGILRTPVTNLLEVNGNASKATAGGWLANSDARLKKNIQALDAEEMLNRLLSLQGISYEWDDDKTENDRPEGIQFGFTAQNIQEVFPSLVSEDNLGYLQTAYGTYDAMTVEALRALHDEIELLTNENVQLATSLKTEWKSLKVLLNETVTDDNKEQISKR